MSSLCYSFNHLIILIANSDCALHLSFRHWLCVTYTYIHTYIYVCMYVCVFMCVFSDLVVRNMLVSIFCLKHCFSRRSVSVSDTVVELVGKSRK